jgi:hypothetical protein
VASVVINRVGTEFFVELKMVALIEEVKVVVG